GLKPQGHEAPLFAAKAPKQLEAALFFLAVHGTTHPGNHAHREPPVKPRPCDVDRRLHGGAALGIPKLEQVELARRLPEIRVRLAERDSRADAARKLLLEALGLVRETAGERKARGHFFDFKG